MFRSYVLITFLQLLFSRSNIVQDTFSLWVFPRNKNILLNNLRLCQYPEVNVIELRFNKFAQLRLFQVSFNLGLSIPREKKLYEVANEVRNERVSVKRGFNRIFSLSCNQMQGKQLTRTVHIVDNPSIRRKTRPISIEI